MNNKQGLRNFKQNMEYEKQIEVLKRKPCIPSDCSSSTSKSASPLSLTNRIVLPYDEMIDNSDEVERRTGFRSLKNMLSFVITYVKEIMT